MNLKVCSDKSRLQSSLDFYLKITSMSEHKNLESLRKCMFNKFMDEEQKRDTSYLSFSMEDDAIELAKEMEEQLEGEVIEEVHGRFLEDYVEMEENDLEEEGDFNKSFVSSSKNFFDAIKSIESMEREISIKRVEHGKYLEDYVEEEIKDIEEVEDNTNIVVSQEYADHGKYLEDYIPDAEEGYSSNDYEEVSIEGINDYEEEEENIEDTTEDDGSWMDTIFSSVKKDEISDVKVESVVEEPEVLEENIEVVEETIKEFIEDTKDNINEVLIDSVQSSTQDINMSFSQEEVEEELPEKEEAIVKPANIRDFIRQHPNSSIEFILKYYSKKEVDKALALGKIYKKKGKLMI